MGKKQRIVEPAVFDMIDWLAKVRTLCKASQAALAIELINVTPLVFKDFQVAARRAGFRVETWPLERGHSASATMYRGRKLAVTITITTSEDNVG